jgi:hypothetical protein
MGHQGRRKAAFGFLRLPLKRSGSDFYSNVIIGLADDRIGRPP